MTRWLDVLDRGFFDLVFPRDCAVTQEPMDDDARLHLSAAGVALLPRIGGGRSGACTFRMAALGADDKVVHVHRGDFRVEERTQFAAQFDHVGSALLDPAGLGLVQFTDDFQPRFEEAFAERFTEGALGRLGVLAEELQVLAVVEDGEKLLVLTGPKQIPAEARAAADHLPKFCF